ncbi:TetR/AcrR family transcriptional regulator C-terminal domain-containing protein [Saccharopolyspora hattusasensis]|uniref:TetR/AcrR family transcriptional regulator C-terminal domain-containing protein n=1 Tax=Saccharopolyspora hattusasensis TaxID=1128679 RepID=UPI003D996F32
MASADQASFARALASALHGAAPGSRVSLIGSLGAGTADEYSDIDLPWVVPDGAMPRCAEWLGEVLGAVAEVASVRSVPEFQRSGLRRLVFVRFRGVPVLEKWLAAGPQSVRERLAPYLRKITERGLLAIDDAKQAALHFNLLTVTTVFQRTFYGSMPMPPGEADESVSGVRAFLRLYGADS